MTTTTDPTDVNPAAPSRPTSTFTLMLGMVPVPVRLFTPTQNNVTVERKMFSPDGNPVGMPLTDLVTGQRVDKASTVKKVDYNGELIELSDDELASVTAGFAVDKGQVPIETLIPLDAIGLRYRVEKFYQARPQKRQIGKKRVDDPVADKAFNLLLKALAAKNVAALFRVGLRSNARYAALTPDGHIHFLFYDDEVRQQVEFPEAEVSDAELGMASQLLDNIGLSVPVLVNESAALVQDYLSRKATGNVEEFEIAEAPVLDSVPDLTALLAASVKA